MLQEYHRIVSIGNDKHSNLDNEMSIKLLRRYDKHSKDKNLLNNRALNITNFKNAVPNNDFIEYFKQINIDIESSSISNDTLTIHFHSRD